jgi:hypothetical protein
MMIRFNIARAGILSVCAALFSHSVLPAKTQKHKSPEVGLQISQNECISKGGIGIINTTLYVDLKSGSNELILNEGRRWIGLPTQETQIVFVSGQKVISGMSISSGFKLEDSVVISFENGRVSFFDFKKGTGGFYVRKIENRET